MLLVTIGRNRKIESTKMSGAALLTEVRFRTANKSTTGVRRFRQLVTLIIESTRGKLLLLATKFGATITLVSGTLLPEEVVKQVFKRILGNYYNTGGRGNVQLKNERFACDPRLRRAAVDCLTANLCDFDADDLQDLARTNIDQSDLIAGT